MANLIKWVVQPKEEYYHRGWPIAYYIIDKNCKF
jgi:hypothetical protein